MKLEYAKDNLTQQPYRHYLKRYQDTSPRVISESSGLTFHEKEQAFLIRFMGVLYQVTIRDFRSAIWSRETASICWKKT